jgi:D-alanine---D-serine ligase
MNKIKLAILFGGKSDEYSVSLHSAAAIIDNVPKELYEVTLVGITTEGKWLHYEGSTDKINNDTWHQGNLNPVLLSMGDFKGLIKLNERDKTYKRIEIDCIFPVLHGRNGEDGTIQGMCQMAGIPFVGCDMTSSAVSMDKEYTHMICEMSGIKTAPFMSVVNHKTLNIKNLYKEALEKLSLPLFIKPANNGSSIGISKVRNYDEFEKGIMEAFEYDKKIVIESNIEGFEIGCVCMDKESLIFEGIIRKLNIDEPDDKISEDKINTTYKALISCITTLPPKQFVLLSTLIGILLIDDIDPKDQIILGKFINNIGQTILTAAAQEQINIKKEN